MTEDINILTESIIKIEDVKEEPVDEEDDWNTFEELKPPIRLFLDAQEPIGEVKQEHEEELKPPIRVFLVPEEVHIGEVKQEHEDPLAMCNETFHIKSEWSSGPGDLPSQQRSAERPSSGGSQESETLPSQSAQQLHELSREEDPQPSASSGLVHKRSKAGKRVHSCDVCGRSFIMHSHLVNHIRIHTRERPYQCDVCKMSFSLKHSLRTHMFKHTGELPFSCHLCSKSFTHSRNLSDHMRTHTGERPFRCVLCSKSFATSSTLSRHRHIHTLSASTDASSVKKPSPN